MTTNPFDGTQSSTSSWDTLILGSIVFPGIIQNFSLNTSYDYDVKKAKDKDKAYIAYTGTQARQINCSVQIYTKEQYDIWSRDIAPQLNLKADGSVNTPWAITHPQCEQFGIRQVVIQNISVGQPTSSGGHIISFTFLEFIEAPPRARANRNPRQNEAPGTRNRRSFPANGPSRPAQITPNQPPGSLDSLLSLNPSI